MKTQPSGAVASPALRALAAAGILSAAAFAVFAYLIDPYNPPRIVPECVFRAVTGFHCPGCGLLRACHAMARGDIAAALGYNVLVVLVVFPAAVFFLLSLLSVAARGRPLRVPNISVRPAAALIALILLFWILRNISVYPFTILAP